MSEFSGKNSEESIRNLMTKITLDEINPYIRRASKHLIEAGLDTGIRINVHYQLHYIVKGQGEVTINNKLYHVSEGDFLIWCPGELHRIVSDVENPLQVIGIQFDFTRRFCEMDYPCIHYNEVTFSWDKVNEIVSIQELQEITSYTQVVEKEWIKDCLQDLVKIFESNSLYSGLIMSGLLKAVIIKVFEGNLNNDRKFKIKKLVIIELLAYINDHQQDKLSNLFLGDRFGYHPNHLNQMFLNHTGYTIQQYIIHVRMSKAIDLLLHTNQSISEIGFLVGGYSIHYFSRLFKNKVGVTPSEFRR